MTRIGDLVLETDSNADKLAEDCSQDFLQTVVDALPESMVVIDRSYNVILANRAAREQSGRRFESEALSKCYQYFHRRATPCPQRSARSLGAEQETCPLHRVFETGQAIRLYHSHKDNSGRDVSVAIDAAPILDRDGNVILVIECCRNVTERTLSRRLLRIGNSHMALAPLLDDYSRELREFTGCAKVGIHVLDDEHEVCCRAGAECRWSTSRPDQASCDACAACVCFKFLTTELGGDLLPTTKRGSIRLDHVSEFLAAASRAAQNRLGAFSWRECESVALIPIRRGNLTVGLIHVADGRPHAIPVETVESLERLSLELATAIHRVRIEEALQSARDELESRVKTRTAELTRTNCALRTEIDERVRLEREILHVSEREQQRIGQELHDGVGQQLTGMSYLAQDLLLTLKAKEAPEAEVAAELASGIPRALDQIQKIVRGLVVLDVGARDLDIALDVLTSNVSRLTGVACQFISNGCDLIHDDDTAIQVYRIVQEAVTNAVKHAGARTIDVKLESHGDDVRLEVCDDGVGISDNAGRGAGCGVRSMMYRARAIGGDLEVRRRSVRGTAVVCVFRQGPDADDNTEASNDGA